jgi:hypothetical protein
MHLSVKGKDLGRTERTKEKRMTGWEERKDEQFVLSFEFQSRRSEGEARVSRVPEEEGDAKREPRDEHNLSDVRS